MNLEVFKASVDSIANLTVKESSTKLTVTSNDQPDPFFELSKRNYSVAMNLDNYDGTQSDFAQFNLALGSCFVQSTKPNAKLNLSDALAAPDPDEDTALKVNENGDIERFDGRLDDDEISEILIKWFMELLSKNGDDPILGLVGLARIVEGKWDYSDTGDQAKTI